MNAYFSNPENLARLAAVAAGWIGTPFMPNAAVRGAGVSCQKLVGALYVESGFIPAGFQIPEGPMDWSHAQKESLIVKFMDEHADKFTAAASWQPGDMIGFKIGGCLHHAGVVLDADGKMIHCLRNTGTIYSNLRDATYLSRIEKIWRPVKP
jgi:hypothetical protein